MMEGKKQFVRELQAGDKVKSTFLVTKKDTKKDKNDKYFCDLELQDMTGKIAAKIWSEAIKLIDINSFKKKDVIFVEGEVKEWSGRQIFIRNLKKIDEKEIDYSVFDFKGRTIDEKIRKALINDLKAYIDDSKNIYIKTLLKNFFDDDKFLDKFCSSTAAVKNHHASVGGLLLHTISVVRICEFILDTYNKESKFMNKDLVVCGAILHDIGKTIGYSVENFLHINEDDENLIGHITIGYGMVLNEIERIKNFPDELKRSILHIILSHHGEKEYGSPVEPQTLESIVVYNADRFDADIDHYMNLAKESPEDESWPFSNYFKRRISVKKIMDKKDENRSEEPLEDANEKSDKSGIGSINRAKLENFKKAILSNENSSKSTNFLQNSNKEQEDLKEDKAQNTDFEQPQLL
ncbi:MAG: HD domain-containing protein [Actinomycetota bacterium]|nr:HD domain-containing protein [Actinomycetota bacterium]